MSLSALEVGLRVGASFQLAPPTRRRIRRVRVRRQVDSLVSTEGGIGPQVGVMNIS